MAFPEVVDLIAQISQNLLGIANLNALCLLFSPIYEFKQDIRGIGTAQ